MRKQIYIALITLFVLAVTGYGQRKSNPRVITKQFPNELDSNGARANPYTTSIIPFTFSFEQIIYDTVSNKWFFYGLQDNTTFGEVLGSYRSPSFIQILDSTKVGIFRESYGIFDLEFSTPFGVQLAHFKAVSYRSDSIYWFGGSKMLSNRNYFPLPVIYLGSPLGTHDVFDTVSIARLISDVALVRSSPRWVLFTKDSLPGLQNSYSYNLAYKDSSGHWQYHPIVYDPGKGYATAKWLLILLPFILIAVSIVLALRNRQINIDARKREKQISFETVFKLESDAPIDRRDQDELGFAPIYNAVSDIIKSPSKPRPLTIVVNGKWGSGKSSIMKIVQSELNTNAQTSKQYVTVWFNAWHQEDESSLMNAFLLSIVHSYEQHSKFRLRVRILMRRILSLSLLKKVGLGLTFTLAVLVLFSVIFLILDNSVSWFPLHNNPYADRLQFLLSQFTINDEKIESKTRAISGIITAVLSMIFLNAESKSIGLAALKNLIVKNNFQIAAETKDPGFREQFRKQYWELLESIGGEKTLVVFIDDLDRVSGAKIFQQLEAINFISDIAASPLSSKKFSNTVFVLGMDSNRVAKALGYHILKEIKKPEIPGSEEAYLEEGYAYLQKMVQLTVPVPTSKNTHDNEQAQ